MWASILGAVLLIALFLVTYRLVQTQKHVEGVQSELVSAKHEAARANDQIVNLKKQVAGLTSELHQTCAALQNRVKEQPLNSRLGV